MPSPRTILCLTAASTIIAGAALVAPFSPPVQTPVRTVAFAQPADDDDQPLAPGPVRLMLRDGTTIEGQFLEQTPTRVVVEVEGVRVTYPTSEIMLLEAIPPVLERYRELRRAIADDDVEQLILLARWLMRRDAPALAVRELRGVLLIEPSLPEANELLRLAEAQADLLAGSEGVTRDPGEHEARRAPPDKVPLLAPEQINLLKVFEVDLRRPPSMRIPRSLIDDILTEYADHELIPRTPEGRAALYRQPPERILNLLFQLRARDLYGRVEVLGTPDAFRRFREDVHRGWLVRGCATARCHGGGLGGRFWLAYDRPNADPTMYTNFLIIDRYRLSDGTPLINYEEPARSPLLQMALAPGRSEFPHPPVNHLGRDVPVPPVFRSVDDPRFIRTVSWIRSMYTPRPDYPITYELPVPPAVQDLLDLLDPDEPRERIER